MISSVPGVAKTMATFECHLQSLLKHGKAEDLIARINCSPRFNMRNVLVTRDTLFRLGGYGTTACDRYLDDQVSPHFLRK